MASTYQRDQIMKAHRLPALLCLAAWPLAAPASEPTECRLTDDRTSCTRVLACIGDQGRWFNGRAMGRGEGTLAGTISDGTICAGTWTERNIFGAGQADVACDDGMTVTVIYFYQEPYTGTAIGRGIASTGVGVKSWSGLHVLDYLKQETGLPHATLPCGAFDIPIS